MLVLIRHGESAWNAEDRFTGSADVPLTTHGRAEARAVGRQLRDIGLEPAAVHTSRLSRARDTVTLLLETLRAEHVPVHATELLNERHYGALQGVPRSSAVEMYGAAQVARWRRGIHDRPPPGVDGGGESLADVRARLEPYVSADLLPALATGPVVVVAHGNTLRMLVQAVTGASEDEARGMELQTGGVLVIERDLFGFG